ncbi:basic helix-loop-helix protein [Lobulomyces angularis]|nr:basic helix-loop-helix protein [Lobulomyces angularis]
MDSFQVVSEGMYASNSEFPSFYNQQRPTNTYSQQNDTSTHSTNSSNSISQLQSTILPTTQKLTVGSEEWLKVRRENHKQVERRRRETINEGISELAKLLPEGNKADTERNKGRVLQRTVEYINNLKEQVIQTQQRLELEKLLCEQAVQELVNQLATLKKENLVLLQERQEREQVDKSGTEDSNIDEVE